MVATVLDDIINLNNRDFTEVNSNICLVDNIFDVIINYIAYLNQDFTKVNSTRCLVAVKF